MGFRTVVERLTSIDGVMEVRSQEDFIRGLNIIVKPDPYIVDGGEWDVPGRTGNSTHKPPVREEGEGKEGVYVSHTGGNRADLPDLPVPDLLSSIRFKPVEAPEPDPGPFECHRCHEQIWFVEEMAGPGMRASCGELEQGNGRPPT